MAIAVSCPCGRSMQVSDEWAGKRARCPTCNVVLVVPAAKKALADDVLEADLVDDAPPKKAAAPSAQVTPAKGRPAKPKPAEDDVIEADIVEDDDDEPAPQRAANRNGIATKPTARRRDEDDDDDRPRRPARLSRDDEEDEDDRPRRKPRLARDDNDEDDRPRRSRSRDDDRPRKPRREPRRTSGGGSSTSTMAGIFGGLGMMLIAVVWFVAGLYGGILFYYPPVLFVLGIIAFVRGLMGRE